MGTSNPNFTMRLPDEIRNPIKDAAAKFGLKECDIARILLARGVPSLRKKSITLHANAMQRRAS
jgi:hypothetical protein